MNIKFLRYLIKLGFHGVRHKISGVFVDTQAWSEKKQVRDDKLSDWCHNNGVGV